MSSLLVRAIAEYLAATGWHPQRNNWRGASIWVQGNSHVLVPPRDDMGDTDLRMREILSVLATVERRSADEIAVDIASPRLDSVSYRTFPENLPSGYTTLSVGLRALQSVRDVLDAAGRAVIEGPHFAFPGPSPRPVGELLKQVQLGPTQSGSYTFTIKLPLDQAANNDSPRPPFGRLVAQQMHDAASAARIAATAAGPTGNLSMFDDAVTAGVSAEFCEALSELSGPQRQQPFEVRFRWARGLSSDLPSNSIAFGEGAGAIILTAAQRLRHLNVSGKGTVVGIVEGLHDDPPGGDRWRIKVRGDLITQRGTGTRRTIWVRLHDQAGYDKAIAAHREQRRVRADGVLSTANGRVELLLGRDRFEVLK